MADEEQVVSTEDERERLMAKPAFLVMYLIDPASQSTTIDGGTRLASSVWALSMSLSSARRVAAAVVRSTPSRRCRTMMRDRASWGGVSTKIRSSYRAATSFHGERSRSACSPSTMLETEGQPRVPEVFEKGKLKWKKGAENRKTETKVGFGLALARWSWEFVARWLASKPRLGPATAPRCSFTSDAAR